MHAPYNWEGVGGETLELLNSMYHCYIRFMEGNDGMLDQ